MTNRLFVYGTLMPGCAPAAMRDVVARLRPVGPAAVRGRMYDLGAYPGLLLDPAAGWVHGMLLDVPPDAHDVWPRMDAYEGFVPEDPGRSLFCRVPCRVGLTGGGGGGGDLVDAWVYVYNGDPAGARQVPGGTWQPDGHPHRERHPAKSYRRPLIGITLGTSDAHPGRYELPMDYGASIERAGGLPLVLPYRTDLSLIPEMVDALDGVLFIGGDDLDPALYGETYHPHTEPIDPARQRFELALLAEVERRRVPALGVCLGSQLMNVHRGGSLIQYLPDHDRPDPVEHRRGGDPTRRHPVQIEPGTILAEVIGTDRVSVNTRHKQAVKRLGRGLRVNARAPDGVIEGIEDPELPLFLAVQWHPENLSTEPEHLAPFKLLVNKAGETRR